MSISLPLGGKPSKLLFVLLGITLVSGLLLGYLLMFPTSIKTENLNITNISDSSVTIVWTTDKSAKATVEVVGGNKYVDDRDTEEVDQGVYAEVKDGSKARYTHHVTLRNLEPEKDYSFEIKNNGKVSKVEVTKFKTYSTVDRVSTPDPVYGRVKDVSGNLLGDTYVILKKTSESGHESEYVSAVAEKGAYSLDLANVRGKGENKLFKDQDGDFEELQIFVNLNGKVETKKVNVPLVSDQPVTDITIGSSATGLNNTILIDSFATDECTEPFGHDCDVPKCGKCEIKGQVSDCIGSMNCREGFCVDGSADPDVVCGTKVDDRKDDPKESEDKYGDDPIKPNCVIQKMGYCEGVYMDLNSRSDNKFYVDDPECSGKSFTAEEISPGQTGCVGNKGVAPLKGKEVSDGGSCSVTDETASNYCPAGCDEDGRCLIDDRPVSSEEDGECMTYYCSSFIDKKKEFSCNDKYCFPTAGCTGNDKRETTYTYAMYDTSFFCPIGKADSICSDKIKTYCSGNSVISCQKGEVIDCELEGKVCKVDNSDMEASCVKGGECKQLSCEEKDGVKPGFACDDGACYQSSDCNGEVKAQNEEEYREKYCSSGDYETTERDTYEIGIAYNTDLNQNSTQENPNGSCRYSVECVDSHDVKSVTEYSVAERKVDCAKQNSEEDVLNDLYSKYDRKEYVCRVSGVEFVDILSTELLTDLMNKVQAQGSELISLSKEEMAPGAYEVVGSDVTTKQIELTSPSQVKVFNDKNGNGIRDLGEDYVSEDQYASLNISFQKKTDAIGYKLTTGWNLIHIPMVMNTEDSLNVKKASELIAEFTKQGITVTHIGTYRSGKFVMYSNRVGEAGDVTFGEDFNILPGEGYFVRSYKAGDVTLKGLKVEGALEVVVESGWNLVGVYNSNVESYKGFSTMQQMNTQGVKAETLSKWESGQYFNLVSKDGTAYGNDFNLYPNIGYWVQNTGTKSKFSPK